MFPPLKWCMTFKKYILCLNSVHVVGCVCGPKRCPRILLWCKHFCVLPPREEDVPVRGTGEQSRGSGKETRRAGTSDGGFQPRVAGSYNVALYRPARAHSSAGRLGKLAAGVLPIDYIPWPADNNTDLPNCKSNSWKTRFLLRGCIKKRFFLRKNSARGEG